MKQKNTRSQHPMEWQEDSQRNIFNISQETVQLFVEPHVNHACTKIWYTPFFLLRSSAWIFVVGNIEFFYYKDFCVNSDMIRDTNISSSGTTLHLLSSNVLETSKQLKDMCSCAPTWMLKLPNTRIGLNNFMQHSSWHFRKLLEEQKLWNLSSYIFINNNHNLPKTVIYFEIHCAHFLLLH